MKECLYCNKDFESKRDSAKYCSDKCKMQWNRKNPKKEKGLTELQQMKVMYNTLLQKIDNLSVNKIETNTAIQKKEIFAAPKEITKKLFIKRSPENYVELRRDIPEYDEEGYRQWLSDVDNDPYLTDLLKKQIKATI